MCKAHEQWEKKEQGPSGVRDQAILEILIELSKTILELQKKALKTTASRDRQPRMPPLSPWIDKNDSEVFLWELKLHMTTHSVYDVPKEECTQIVASFLTGQMYTAYQISVLQD